MKQNTHMKHVAARCGVSISTVSRALRGDSLVASGTSEKIRKVAEELGYRPNPYVSTLMAQLRGSRPRSFKAIIALVDCLPHKEDWMQYAVQQKFDEGARKRADSLGYRLERFWSNEKNMSPTRLSQILVSRGIQGVLLPPFHEYSTAGLTSPVHLEKFTCVTLGWRSVDPEMHFVMNDQFATANHAHSRMMDLGYNRVGLAVSDFVDDLVGRRFSAGFCASSERRMGKVPAGSVLRYDRKNGRKDLEKWMNRFKPDAVCAVQDEVKIWLDEMGFRFPQTLGLATLDWEASERNMSGINQDSLQVGQAAVELLVQLLQRNYASERSRPYGITTEGFWVDGSTGGSQLNQA